MTCFPSGWNQLPAPDRSARWRPSQGAASCVYVEQHNCHCRGLGPIGPEVRFDVQETRLCALVRICDQALSEVDKSQVISLKYIFLCVHGRGH